MPNQVASSSTRLTGNTYIRPGYTFAGWATSSSGSVVYADEANYAFSSSVTLFASWSANSAVTPSATVSLGVPVGGFIPGTFSSITAQGLLANASFDVVLRSTPLTLSSGLAVAGAVNTSVTMPPGLEAGWHSLTFRSTAADGSAFSHVLYFQVSEASTLLATSSNAPESAGLARTGSQSAEIFGNAALALIAGTGLLGASLARRKKINIF